MTIKKAVTEINYIEVTLDETVLKQLGYDVKYEEDDWRKLELISFQKNGQDITDFVIPATYSYNGKNYKITQIGDYAFNGCLSLTSITIPQSITKIGNNAFRCCSSLKSITIANSVTQIGDYAFSDCSLTNITIPDSVTEIGEEAFSCCSSLYT